MPGREFRGEETVDVGGEWFLMWQSKMWNGQEEAFRMFTILGMAFLVVVQREPTRDQSATLLLGVLQRLPVTRSSQTPQLIEVSLFRGWGKILLDDKLLLI
jgi:hypothetical protein